MFPDFDEVSETSIESTRVKYRKIERFHYLLFKEIDVFTIRRYRIFFVGNLFQKNTQLQNHVFLCPKTEKTYRHWKRTLSDTGDFLFVILNDFKSLEIDMTGSLINKIKRFYSLKIFDLATYINCPVI